jgi:predicted esterase
MSPSSQLDPHAGQPLAYAGLPLGKSPVVVVMVHGRGSNAESILGLAQEFGRRNITYLAPQAAGYTWYPNSFLAPIESNEPYLSSALQRLASVLERTAEAGIALENTVLLGFSQGACLVSEFAARTPLLYGGIVALSGGVIGPPGTPRQYTGDLRDTPVFIGCSDRDPHIPLERVHETTEVFTNLGGAVVERIYPGMGHTINQDELSFITDLLDTLIEPNAS